MKRRGCPISERRRALSIRQRALPIGEPRCFFWSFVCLISRKVLAKYQQKPIPQNYGSQIADYPCTQFWLSKGLAGSVCTFCMHSIRVDWQSQNTLHGFNQHAKPVSQSHRWRAFSKRASGHRNCSSRPQARQREEIYYVTFPLVGLESIEGAIVFSGRELPNILAQHCAIIVERPTEQVNYRLEHAVSSCSLERYRT